MAVGSGVKSYMLGEIPSLKDRITIVCQLWDLSRDVLVSVEPGTPHDLKPYLRCDVTYYGWRKGEPWPLDGMEFETLKEQHAKRNPRS
nr:hypothetical protein CFP56_54805 [Quercus suber]POF12550.1 hypothetical protein CFP56_62262 [Quercus suber]